MRSPVTVRSDRDLSRARLVAILTPSALLGGAIAFQYLGGLAPCQMCYWQRWPHLAAILVALGAIALRSRSGPSALLTLLAGFGILASGAIGVFHAGVEQHWWKGLTTCSTAIGGQGGASALDAIMNAPLVRCDVPAWTLLGISMAGYNAIISILAALAVFGLLGKWGRGT